MTEIDGSTTLDITDVAAVAAHLGMTEDDECTPDGIDWGYTGGPAEGAPVFLVGGWYADDGNCAVHYEHATSGSEAAREYVADGDWGDGSGTAWVTVHYWQECVSIDDSGARITGRYAEGSEDVAIEPGEPECAPGGEHDWRAPYSLVGGIKENPGVQGHGGGVICREVCVRCGCERVTNTWAQNPANGTQGLTLVSYEEGAHTIDHDLEAIQWDGDIGEWCDQWFCRAVPDRFDSRDEAERAQNTIDVVVSALADVAEVQVLYSDRGRIPNYAPDSAEFDGDTSPGSAWDEECDARLAAVREALPAGWTAEWVDDDLYIERDEA